MGLSAPMADRPQSGFSGTSERTTKRTRCRWWYRTQCRYSNHAVYKTEGHPCENHTRAVEIEVRNRNMSEPLPIFFVKRFQRSYDGHPALLPHRLYRGTTTIRTSTYTGIHAMTAHGTNAPYTAAAAAVLSCNSCHCTEILSTNKIPRQARPVEQIGIIKCLIAP